MHKLVRTAGGFLAVATLSACGGGGGGSSQLPPAAKKVAAGAQVSVRILVPRSVAHKSRRPLYVSASTKSLKIVVDGADVTNVNVASSSPGCQAVANGTACSTTLYVAPGTRSFVMTALDGANGTGVPLSVGSVTQPIVVGTANAVDVALDGIVAKVHVALAQAAPPEGTKATVPLAVAGLDADGNTIIGGGSYDTPIKVTVADSTGSTSLSTATVDGPGTPVSIVYNGKPLSSAGANAFINATAGNASASTYFVTQQADWSTWGNSPSRGSYNGGETTLTASTVGGLHTLWSTNKSLTGILTAQPVVASNVMLADSGPTDVLYEGDENGMFSALNAGTGKLLWQNQLKTESINFSDPNQSDCKDQPGGVFGIGSTAAVDRTNNLVWVADGQGLIYGFDLATGNQVKKFVSAFHGPFNDPNPAFNHMYGALTLDAKNGLLYAPVGAKCGLNNDGAIVQYNTTTGAAKWFYPGGGERGGVWGPGGVPLDPNGSGDIFLATADGPQVPTAPSINGPFGSSVLRLKSNGISFSVVGYNTPVNLGPAVADFDFGATPLVFTPNSGCGKTLLVAGNKDGELFVYDANDITNNGNGAIQRMIIGHEGQDAGVSLPSPAYDPVSGLVFVNNGSDSTADPQFKHGLLAFSVNGLCQLSLAWTASVGPNNNADGPPAPPTVANGVVYYADGPGTGCSTVGNGNCTPGTSDLYAFAAGDGRQLARVGLRGPLFAAPTVVNGHVYVASWNGYGPGAVYALGL